MPNMAGLFFRFTAKYRIERRTAIKKQRRTEIRYRHGGVSTQGQISDWQQAKYQGSLFLIWMCRKAIITSKRCRSGTGNFPIPAPAEPQTAGYTSSSSIPTIRKLIVVLLV